MDKATLTVLIAVLAGATLSAGGIHSANAERGGKEKSAPYWGVTAQTMNADMLDSLGLNDKNLSGTIVVERAKDSPAAKVLKQGDVIVAVNGQKTSTAEELNRLEKISTVGEKTKLTVYRDGALTTVYLIPERPPTAIKNTDEREWLRGVKFKVSAKGQIIVEASENNPLFLRGDVILKINDLPIENMDDLEKAIAAETKAVTVTVRRGSAIISSAFSSGDGGNFFSQSVTIG